MQPELVIKTSPVVFLKRLIIIEFAWAFFAVTLSIWLDLPGLFESAGLSRFGTFSLMLTIVFTLVQVLIIAGAFISWYFDTYRIGPEKITHIRLTSFGRQIIGQTQNIADLRVQQSALGERLNYGTLALALHGTPAHAALKNIPNPQQTVADLKKLVRPRQLNVEQELNKPVPQLIAQGENQYVEFKSSFSWDYRRNSINRGLNKAVMKNIVGFMNAGGGVVLLGVDDEGEILGLEIEFQSLSKPNVDGFENTLNTAFNNAIGAEYRHYVKIDFTAFDAKTVCRILVLPSPEPVFLRHKNHEEFYVRSGNLSQPFSLSQAVKYIQTHFTS
jgi:hypothetical protein